MADLKEKMAELAKKYGDDYGRMGGEWEQAERIPTGIFDLDFALGGGVPRGRCTEIYGNEGAGKTTVCYKIIAEMQAAHPEEKAVFVDMEGTWDPNWAERLGVKADAVLVLKPDTAEQVTDMIYDLMEADDLGVIILDSLAATVSMKEIEVSADKAIVGNTALTVKRLVNKVAFRFKEFDRSNKKMRAALVFINQIRTKVGVMFGDPETTPGGNSPRFLYSLRVRLWGSSKTDNSVSDVLAVAKHVRFSVRKHKVPICAMSGEYDLITLPHEGFEIGECDDWKSVERRARDLGVMSGDSKTGYTLLGVEYKKLQDLKLAYHSDDALRRDIQRRLIRRGVEATGFVLPTEMQNDI